MSSLPLSPSFLPAPGQNIVIQPENSKSAPDGFQALLDIGNDVGGQGAQNSARKVLPTRKDVNEESVVALVDGPKEPVSPKTDTSAQPRDNEAGKKDVSPANEAARQKQDIDSTDKPATSKQDDDKAENKSGAADQENSVNSAQDASPQDKAASVQDAAAAGAKADVAVDAGDAISQQIDAVQSALFGILAQISGQPVTDIKSAQQVLASLSQQQTGGALAGVSQLQVSPQFIQQLQSLVSSLQALGEGVRQELPATGIDIPAFVQHVQALLAGNSLQGAAQNIDKNLINQLEQELEGLARALESFAGIKIAEARQPVAVLPQADGKQNAEITDKADKFLSPSFLAKSSPAASEQVAPQVQSKPETAQAHATNIQSNARIETGLPNSNNGFDLSGGQKDAAGLIGLTRAATLAAPQATQNAPAFSRLLEQSNARPVVDQIAFQIRNVAQTGTSRIHIQLHPAELGKVEVKMDVDSDGKATLTITTDNKHTFDMLQRDRSGLERALADAGLKADSGDLNFNLRGEQQGQQDQPSFSKNYPVIPDEEPILPDDLLTSTYTLDVVEGLDIKI